MNLKLYKNNVKTRPDSKSTQNTRPGPDNPNEQLISRLHLENTNAKLKNSPNIEKRVSFVESHSIRSNIRTGTKFD